MDDKFFVNISPEQYAWYQHQFLADDKEEYELMINIAEHNAMFTNPEGVNKVRSARENTYGDSNFQDTIKSLFGRELNDDDSLDKVSFTPIRG